MITKDFAWALKTLGTILQLIQKSSINIDYDIRASHFNRTSIDVSIGISYLVTIMHKVRKYYLSTALNARVSKQHGFKPVYGYIRHAGCRQQDLVYFNRAASKNLKK